MQQMLSASSPLGFTSPSPQGPKASRQPCSDIPPARWTPALSRTRKRPRPGLCSSTWWELQVLVATTHIPGLRSRRTEAPRHTQPSIPTSSKDRIWGYLRGMGLPRRLPHLSAPHVCTKPLHTHPDTGGPDLAAPTTQMGKPSPEAASRGQPQTCSLRCPTGAGAQLCRCSGAQVTGAGDWH